jgi:hypothetical protein
VGAEITDFAHPVLMIIWNCSLIRCCRIRTIMSNHAPPTCGVLADEQCGRAGVPDDHEQSGAVVVSAGN